MLSDSWGGVHWSVNGCHGNKTVSGGRSRWSVY